MNLAAFPGHELKARREELGMSAEDVYRRIRVPAMFVESIEAGLVDNLPVSCYAVGFLKSYCQFLGVDSNRYVDFYLACIRPASRILHRKPEEKRKRETPKWARELAAWAAVCGIIAMGWFAYHAMIRPNLDPAKQRAHAATTESLRVPSTPPAIKK
ncbi:MAG: hypothetical protein AMXMBFR4_16030 [Candidatus Hydrogenedentota bacterium]